MTETWEQGAARRRPAEDRVIARYRQAFFGGDAPAPDRGYPTVSTDRGLACEFFPAMAAARIARRSAWPETQIVIDIVLDFTPQRHGVVMWPMWSRERWDDQEPRYNDVLGINIGEAVQKRFDARLSGQRGPTLYFIWESPVDLSNPPALGGPPEELLLARDELDRIRRQIEAGP